MEGGEVISGLPDGVCSLVLEALMLGLEKRRNYSRLGAKAVQSGRAARLRLSGPKSDRIPDVRVVCDGRPVDGGQL